MAPRIIPRKEHPLSRKLISPNALRTLYRLHNRGFIAYLVGGCVRDLLLERTPKDFDIATNATPSQIRRLFRNCFLVGRRFRLAHLHFQDEILEVATFRGPALPFENPDTEEAKQNGRSPRYARDKNGMVLRENVFGTPEEDALSRDFTINALAYNIADFSIIDYTTGLSDLEQRLIRPIGDPYVRFTEDPVRMIRAVRLSASHNLVIEPNAWETICELSSTITRAAPARLYEEIQKLFLRGSGEGAFRLLDKSGLLAALFPVLSRWIYGDSRRQTLVHRNLEYLDRLFQKQVRPSPALFLAALFGPTIEEAALGIHRNGIPYQQALDAAQGLFMKETCSAVSIPGKVGNQLRAILALQRSLHRMPPRRPHSVIARPEFAEAMTYLRLGAETKRENRRPLEWWDDFLLKAPLLSAEEAKPQGPPAKRRKRKRRRRPTVPETTV